jgi:Fis family transcriptional regulator, factor for inversion stimulation protein
MKDALDALISPMHKGGILYSEAVQEFRKAFIATALRENNGNQSKAARALGMHRNTLSRTMSILGLDVNAVSPGSRRLPQSERLVSVAKRSWH